MINRIKLSILFFVLVAGQNVYSQKDSVQVNIKELEVLYNSGSYVNAELTGRRLLESPVINDSIRVEIHKYVAFSLIAQGKTDLAKEQFVSLLKVKPDYDLDPVYTSPKILVIFRETQQEFLSSQNTLKNHNGESKITGSNTITYRTIIFPGWEQLHQDRKTAGRIFFGAGITTLGAGIVFEILRSNARKNYLAETNLTEINNKYDIYNRYYKAEIISFIAFAAFYLASEFDVFFSENDFNLSINSDAKFPQKTNISFSIRF